jgi:hypothetical protein
MSKRWLTSYKLKLIKILNLKLKLNWKSKKSSRIKQPSSKQKNLKFSIWTNMCKKDGKKSLSTKTKINFSSLILLLYKNTKKTSSLSSNSRSANCISTITIISWIAKLITTLAKWLKALFKIIELTLWMADQSFTIF